MRTFRSALVPALLASLVVGGAGACARKPSKEDCQKLLEHLVDLEAAASGAGGTTPEQKASLQQQKTRVEKSIGLDFCRKEMSIDQLRCGLKARSLDEIGKTCDKT